MVAPERLPPQAAGSVQSFLQQLAAPRWTVLFFLATAAASLLVAQGGMTATPVMLAPFILLMVNLLAAIVTNARFRADVPLLIFHLALLALIALIAIARLVYLDARTTLSQGQAFEGRADRSEQGPLNAGGLSRLQFLNDGFSARYSENGTYLGTYNRIRWQGSDEQWRETEIGDDRPLLLQGYRIYATVHRGLSPLFVWRPRHGEPSIGTVQLRDHRKTDDHSPAAGWKLPDGPDVWIQLKFSPLPDPRGTRQQGLGAAELDHVLVLRSGDTRREEIRVGDEVTFAEGSLQYLKLDSWMSYRIVYDPTVPWIIAVIFVGVGSLCWYYLARFKRSPIAEPGA